MQDLGNAMDSIILKIMWVHSLIIFAMLVLEINFVIKLNLYVLFHKIFFYRIENNSFEI